MIDIPAARAICEAATKGVWLVAQSAFHKWQIVATNLPSTDARCGACRFLFNADAATREDCEFVDFARIYLPEALNEIEELREEVKNLKLVRRGLTSACDKHFARNRETQNELDQLRARVKELEGNNARLRDKYSSIAHDF